MQEKGHNFVSTTNIQNNVGIHHRCLSRQVDRSLIVGENKRFVFVQAWRDEPRKFPGSGCHSFSCISTRKPYIHDAPCPTPNFPPPIFFAGLELDDLLYPCRSATATVLANLDLTEGLNPSSYYFWKFPRGKPMNIKDFCSHKLNELYPPTPLFKQFFAN